MTDLNAISTRTIKVRIEADAKTSQSLANTIATMLEKLGFEVIEISKAFPLREDQGRARSYVGALPVEKGDKNVE